MAIDTLAVASAMDVQITMQEIAARNVANIGTPGFKRNIAVVESVQKDAGGDGMPTLDHVGVDFSQGPLEPTHNELDFAVKGEGFFVVETSKGLRYTRNGRFGLNVARELVTQNGDRVLGDSGVIVIPQGSDKVTLGRGGELRFGERAVATLRIAAFDKPELMKQAGSCQFTDGGNTPRPAVDFRVHQGFLESSNVQPVTELVRMISSLRDYEACARSVRSLGESAGKLYAWAGS